MYKKLGLVLLVLIALGWVANHTIGDQLVLKAMQRQVVSNLSGADFADFGDGLHIVLCGAGSPMPDLKRAGPCVAVIAGEQVLIVDVGSGSARQLAPAGIATGKIAAVLLTHFHSDHIDGLGELLMQRWVNGAHTSPTPVIGPQGVEQVVEGFNRAYTQDFSYRVGHHGDALTPPSGAGGAARPFVAPAPGESLVVYEQGGLKVTAISVEHPPIVPAVAYRFDYQGRSAVISGDTKKSVPLTQLAQGADLLVHEALSTELVQVLTAGADEAGAGNIAQLTRDILDYHTSPVEAAEVAEAAGAKHLLYYHLVPSLPVKRLEPIFLRGVSDAYQGGVTVGQDRSWISLPAGSSEVRVGRRG